MVLEKFVSGDVAGIHSRDGMVHQEFGVDFGHASGGRKGPKGLAEIVAPL